MDKDDEYRRYAQEAQDLADRARNDSDKASWLKIAQRWLQMISKPTPQQQFDDATKAQDTGQERSTKSH